jgi:hypothetical protein
MAKNLQSKLPESDTLVVQDINDEVLERFVKDAGERGGGARVRIAGNPAEAAGGSVSGFLVLFFEVLSVLSVCV